MNQKKINQFFSKSIHRNSQNNSIFSSVQLKYCPQQSDDENQSQSILFKPFAIVKGQKQLKLCFNEEPSDLLEDNQKLNSQNDLSQFTQYTLMRKNEIKFTPLNQKKKKIKKNSKYHRDSTQISNFFKKQEPGHQNNLFKSIDVKSKKSRQIAITKFIKKKQRVQQTSKFMQIPRGVILKIMMFLKLGENILFSMTSIQLGNYYRFLWYFGDYFKNLDSKNFTSKEIDYIRKKSRFIHSKVLNTLLRGRQAKLFFKKNSIKIVNDKQTLQEIQIKPKSLQIPQIYDDNLNQIFEQKSAKLGLQKISLLNCGFLRKIFDIFNSFVNLHNLIITNNPHIHDNQIYQISKNCQFLTQVNLSFCKQLTEQSLTFILSNCTLLQTLNISGIIKIFDDFHSFCLFRHPNYLQKIDISFIPIKLNQIEQIIKNCKCLNLLKIKGNTYLLDEDKKYLKDTYLYIKFIF